MMHELTKYCKGHSTVKTTFAHNVEMSLNNSSPLGTVYPTSLKMFYSKMRIPIR